MIVILSIMIVDQRRPWIHSPPDAIFIDQWTVSDCSLNGSGCSRQVPPAIVAAGDDIRKNAAVLSRVRIKFHLVAAMDWVCDVLHGGP
ncbi:hypothetical protein XI09_10175 [Bradyrhizobium sp. CCBAU 11386]|nr:hypothetical protein [Bradyrhizobium sp. CCBAU 11386]